MAAPLLADEPAAEDKDQAARKPKVRVTISESTTGITEPLRPDGYPDYYAAMNQLMSKGVTPETNAAVLFWQAVGPDQVDAPLRAAYWKLVGINPLPEEGDYLISLEDFVKAHPALVKVPGDLTDWKLLIAQLELARQQEAVAMTRPWKADEFPAIAAWLAASERPFALLVEGSKRPHYYDPMVPETNKSVLWHDSLWGAQVGREFAHTLLARAMLCAARHDFEGMKRDLLASHRIANFDTQGVWVALGFVGVAIHTSAFHAEQALLQAEMLDADQLAELRRDVLAIVKYPDFARAVDIGDRWCYCDALCRTAARGEVYTEALKAFQPEGTLPEGITRLLAARLDYDQALRMGSLWYDRQVAALKIADPAERRKRESTFIDNLQQFVEEKSTDLAARTLLDSKAKVTELVGGRYIAYVMQDDGRLSFVHSHCQMTHEVTDLGFALAQYKLAEGRFPERLEQLVPKFIKAVPKDTFGENELHYTSDGRGYRLYSVGSNGRDDGGRGYEDRDLAAKSATDVSTWWDDIVLRVPAEWKPEPADDTARDPRTK